MTPPIVFSNLGTPRVTVCLEEWSRLNRELGNLREQVQHLQPASDHPIRFDQVHIQHGTDGLIELRIRQHTYRLLPGTARLMADELINHRGVT